MEVAPKNSSAGRSGALDVAVGPRAPLFLLSLRHHHLSQPESSPQVRKCLPLRWRRTEVLSLGGSTTDAEDEEAGSDAESDAPPPRRHRARAPFALLPVDREAAAARAGVDVTTYTAIMEIQVKGRHCHHSCHHHLKILHTPLRVQHRDITPEDYDTLLRLTDSVKPKTLPPSALEQRAPSFAWRPPLLPGMSDAPQTCSICLESLAHGDRCRRLPCRHVFHRECIDTWLGSHADRCPDDGQVIGL